MAKEKPAPLQVQAFADHHVITQPNPLRRVLRRVDEKDLDDPVARAEKALAGLSGEFKDWMAIECDRLAAAHARILNVVANPRPFIKTKSYFGPDRRRSTSNAYIGPERRSGGEAEVLQQPSLLEKARSSS